VGLLRQLDALAQDTYVLAVDIGGTFTDVVLLRGDGALQTLKISSTPPNYNLAVARALSLLVSTGLDPSRLAGLLHGTTVVTNAILESRGALTALLTTRGFRDVLELGRVRHPSPYDIGWEKPQPLVQRRFRVEVDERVNGRGEVERAVDLQQVGDTIAELVARGVESVAISFINSYLNPINERMAAAAIRDRFPRLPLSVSCEVLPEMGEFERTSTTVVNAYTVLVITQYLADLDSDVQNFAPALPILMMQSNGGLISSERARRRPVQLVESGPAAGVIAACSLAGKLQVPSVIAFDMGGTTAKASLVENGSWFEAPEYEVGATINTKRALLRGGGYTIRVPSVDMAEVGAGGGSVVWIDEGGALRVGPQSAGAAPGPACYGAGGREPTVTDAAMVLGYLNPNALAGGAQPVYRQLAVDAIADRVARPLGLGLLEAAYGIYTITISNMSRAIRAVSTERGRDPRDFVLMAFGGAGPVHAVEIAQGFQISRVIVPASPGLFSTIGLLAAHIRHHDVSSYTKREATDIKEVNRVFRLMEDRTLADMARDGYRRELVRVERSADVRYLGQSWSLRVPVPEGELTQDDIEKIFGNFQREYERTYGHKPPGLATEFVNLRLLATLEPSWFASDVFSLGASPVREQAGGETAAREAYFGPRHGLLRTAVVSRARLDAAPVSGPLIIEDMDATTVVPPGWHAWRDQYRNVIVDLG